jgi:hypothetical protein
MLTIQLQQIEITDICLRFSRPLLAREASQLRGWIGGAYSNELLLHHHKPDGSLHYDYPRVQFKVLDNTAHLIGLQEAGPLVTKLWMEVDKARIGLEDLPVLEGTISRRRDNFGYCTEPVGYQLLTPWLGLNQENHRRYESCRSSAERQNLLEKVLVGNCLSTAKALRHHVGVRLSADASGLWPMRTNLKGVEFLGFRGTFRINFSLPDRIGIGKSVSRGFGTVAHLTN